MKLENVDILKAFYIFKQQMLKNWKVCRKI